MTKQLKQQVRNEVVLKRLIDLSNESKEWAEELAYMLDWALDEHASNDGFGTERQMDPRGDCRNKNWTMYRVEGVDK